MSALTSTALAIPAGPNREDGQIGADLLVPERATGLVVFAHGSGSSRFSSRNRRVAEFLHREGFATLLLDLLTPDEEAVDVRSMEFRFDIQRLGPRVSAAADWAATQPDLGPLAIGCWQGKSPTDFGARSSKATRRSRATLFS